MAATSYGVRSLVHLSMRHVEEVVHYKRGVRALEIVLTLVLRNIQILNFVDENGRDFVDVAVACG